MQTQAYQNLNASAAHLFAQIEEVGEIGPASQRRHKALREVVARLREFTVHLIGIEESSRDIPQDVLGGFQPLKNLAYVAAWLSSSLSDVLASGKLPTFDSSPIKEAKALLRELKPVGEHLAKLAYSGLEAGRSAETYLLTHFYGTPLLHPFIAWVEPDDDGFIARCREVPQVYGFGVTPDEAMGALVDELISLREDLNSHDDFSEEYLNLKMLLRIASLG